MFSKKKRLRIFKEKMFRSMGTRKNKIRAKYFFEILICKKNYFLKIFISFKCEKKTLKDWHLSLDLTIRKLLEISPELLGCPVGGEARWPWVDI